MTDETNAIPDQTLIDSIAAGDEGFIHDLSSGTLKKYNYTQLVTFVKTDTSIVLTTRANTYGDGFRQIFNPDATNAGINVGEHTANPSAPVDGDVYLNSTSNQLFARINGAWVDIGAAASGDAWGDVVDANIIPDADGTRNLGSTGTRFDETFTDSIDVTNNITLGGELRTDATPNTDHTANGPTTNTINAGVVTAIGELLYLATDGEWALADADAEATASGMFAVSLAVGADGVALLVALSGSFVRDDTFAFTIGDVLYASTTAGGITATAPSGTGDIVRVIGYAVTADIIYFNPGGSWVEVV